MPRIPLLPPVMRAFENTAHQISATEIIIVGTRIHVHSSPSRVWLVMLAVRPKFVKPFINDVTNCLCFSVRREIYISLITIRAGTVPCSTVNQRSGFWPATESVNVVWVSRMSALNSDSPKPAELSRITLVTLSGKWAVRSGLSEVWRTVISVIETASQPMASKIAERGKTIRFILPHNAKSSLVSSE